jgi:hypothetical protein
MLSGVITSRRVLSEEISLQERRCRQRRGDVVRGEEMSSEERRCRQRRGGVV